MKDKLMSQSGALTISLLAGMHAFCLSVSVGRRDNHHCVMASGYAADCCPCRHHSVLTLMTTEETQMDAV